MNSQLINILTIPVALIVGSIIGFGFGKIQLLAQQRYAKKQTSGALKSGMVIIPGSIQRTAIFLLALALIQIGLPFLFNGNIQWLVSAGILLGYGWTLLQQLRKRTT